MKYFKEVIVLLAFILTIQIVVFLLFKDFRIIQDEYYHFNQIYRYLSGDYSLNPALTTIPGYHVLIATVLRIFQTNSLGAARLVSFIISLSSIIIFYLLAEHIDRKSSGIKTLQYSFFPLALPLFPLVYTDIFSMTLVLSVC